MADQESLYAYRTPFESPDRIRLGDSANGNFSDQEYDSELKRHKLFLYSTSALVGTWDFGADGVIRFNGDAAEGGGTGLTPEDLEAVHVVEDNIAAVLSVQANATEIVAVAAAIDDGTFDDLAEAVLAAENAQASQVAAAASEANASGSALASATSAAAAAVSSTAAAANESGSATNAALARAYAITPADADVVPGEKSARAYAQAAQAFGRQIAGIPSRTVFDPTTSYTLAKTTATARGDEFGVLYCNGSTNKTIVLPRDWNTTAAADGSPSWVPVRIIRYAAGTVTIAGAGGTSITNPVGIGGWQGTYRTATDPPGGTIPAPIVRSISVPAGLKRFLFVTAAEVNNSTTSHTITLAASTGTVTVRTSDTAPTGRLTVSPRVNAKSWTVALADSVDTATNVDITFTLPAAVFAFAYRIEAAKNVGAVSGVTGTSIPTASTTHGLTVTATAGGMALATAFCQGDGLPATMTGGTANAAIESGGLDLKDIAMVSGYATDLSAGGRSFSATFDESKEGAVLGCCFEAAAVGGSTVTVIGTPLTVGSNTWVDVMALSDGVTYIVRHGS